MKNVRHSIIVSVLITASVMYGMAHAHTLDKWEDYRLEIAWENNPAFSGELNAIMLYVSPLVPGLELEEQPFENGISGLEDTLKMHLVSRDSIITLSLDSDAEIPGVYRAYVKVDRAGYYQANVIGTIDGKPISLSMHPPQIRNSEQVTFPQDYDLFHDIYSDQAVMHQNITELYEMHHQSVQMYQEQIDELKSRVAEMDNTNDTAIYAGVAVGLVGIGIAIAALYRTRSGQR